MARILVIDDEKDVCDVLCRILAAHGHAPVATYDGDEGLAAFRAEPAEIVVTDVIMPRQEGLETILELRRIQPAVKIIAISGGGSGGAGEYLALAKQLGARRTLTKPIGSEELLAAVAELLMDLDDYAPV